ncbi:MAG: hypothetical protein ACREAY_01275 [Nitrososphaera sp.]|uniref:hypothetical protein n=1 Tax=Nitrososphaera sp. TaxID=1971748 RepID=UPI003D6F0CF3
MGIGVPMRGAPGRIQETDSQGNIQTRQFITERGPTEYRVNIDDSISGYIPGKTNFNVQLNDRISGGPYSYQRDIGKPDTRDYSPISGLTAPLENIKSTIFGGADILTKGQNTQTYKPELIGDALGSLSTGKTSSIKGGFSLVNPESAKELGKLGTSFVKQPVYYAATAVTGALSFISPTRYLGAG